MKSVSLDAVGIVFGTVALLFGQAAEVVTSTGVANLIQGGAFAVLAYTLLHLVTKTLPRRDKEYADMVEQITDRYSRAMDRQTDRAAETQANVAQAITDLRVHCAERLKAEHLKAER